MHIKKCTICKVEKSITEFNKNKTKKDGYQVHCRNCSHERFKKYYENNREKQLLAIKGRKKKYRIVLQKLILAKLESGCIDCGEKDPTCLDFDHCSNKESNIATMYGRLRTVADIEKEIAKCVVRCANCHRKKTAKDFMWYKSTLGLEALK